MKNKILSFALPLLLALSPVAAPAARLLWVDVRGSATVEDGDTNPTVGEYRSSGTGHSVNAFRVSVPDAEASGGTNRLVFAYEENGSMVVGGSEPVVRSLDFANGGALWAPLDLAAYADRDLVVTMELGYVDPANDSSFEKLAFATEHLGSLLDAPHVSIQSDLNPPALTPWAPETFTVTVPWAIAYDLAGGTNNAANPEFYTEGQLPIALLPAGREGYTFAGWTNELGAIVEKIAADSTGDRSFGATWLENVEHPAGASFIYDGTAKTGVPSGTGYSVAGDATATEPGQYTVTLSLESGYIWSDGTTADKTVTWSIAPAVAMTLSVPDETTGVVTTNYFATLQEAIDATASSDPVATNVVLRGDVEETVVVTNSVAIDLAGHELDGDVTNAVPAVIGTSVPGGGITGDIVSEGDSARLVIEGGEFDGELSAPDGGSISITGGSFAKDPSDFVADGYYAAGDDTNGYDVLPCRSILDTTITVADAEYTGVSQIPAVAVETNGVALVPGTDFTVSYATNDLVNAGTYAIAVNGIGAWKDSVPTNFIITAKSVSITVSAAEKVYGENDPAFTGAVVGLVDENDLGTVAYSRTGSDEDVGTYAGVLTASYTANANYAVTVVPADFTIKPAAMTITVAGYEGVYDGASHDATATTQPTGATVTWSTDGGATWSADVPAILNAGTNEVIAQAVLANYATVTSEVAKLIVTPKAATITVAAAEKVYGENDPAFTGTVEGRVNENDLGAVTYSRTGSDEDVGTYAGVLTASYTANANYTVTVVPADFTIKPAAMTITVAGYEGVYDGASHDATATTQPAGATVTWSTDGGATWSADVPAILNAGTNEVIAQAVLANYATVTSEVAKLIVTPKSVSVTADDKLVVFGDPEVPLTVTVTALVEGESTNLLSWTTSREPGNDVGAYAITVIGAESQGNYAVTFVGGTYTIAPAGTMALQASDWIGVYDGVAHSNAVQVVPAEGTTLRYSVDGGANWTLAAPTLTGVGTLDVFVQATNANYTAVSTNVVLSVTNRPVVVTAGSATKTYDGTALVQDGYTAVGLADGDSFAQIAVSGSQTNVGVSSNEVSVTSITNAVGADVTSNYSITAVDGELKVTKAEIAITVAGTASTAVYNGENQTTNVAYVATSESALFDKSKVQYSGAATVSGTPVGSYPYGLVNTQFTYDDANIDATFTVTDSAFTITKAVATITVDAASKKHGEDDPEFTGTVTGLVSADDLGTVTYGRTNDVQAIGVYEGVIVAYYTANANYDVTVVPGTFTIEENKLTILWVADGSDFATNILEYGEPLAEPSPAPTKVATDLVAYTFDRWDPTPTDTVLSNATYTAVFTETSLANAIWIGGDAGGWDVPGNWDIGFVPTSATVVTFTNDAEVVIGQDRCKEMVISNAYVTVAPASGASEPTLHFAGNEERAVSVPSGATGTLAVDDICLFNDDISLFRVNSGFLTIGSDFEILNDVTFRGMPDPQYPGFAGKFYITGKATICGKRAEGAVVCVRPIENSMARFSNGIEVSKGVTAKLRNLTTGAAWAYKSKVTLVATDNATDTPVTAVWMRGEPSPIIDEAHTNTCYVKTREGAGSFENVSYDIFEARWKPTVKTVTGTGATVTGVAEGQYVTPGEKLAIGATDLAEGCEAILVITKHSDGSELVKTKTLPCEYTMKDFDIDVSVTAVLKTFEVVWVAEGAETTNKVDYGTATASIRPANPAKAGDDGALYTFAGWTPEPDATVTSNAIYTAVFKTWTKVAVPVVATGLVYDGTEQTGVSAGEGYTLSGWTAATNAGVYGAWATLAENRVWSDATDPTDRDATADRQIEWSIAKRAITVAAADASKIAGNPDPEFSASITSGTLADGQEIAYSFAVSDGAAASTKVVTPSATITVAATGADATANYDVTAVPGTLSIGEAKVSVFTVADNGATTNAVGYYATIADAVAAATNGCTVLLLDDATLAERVEPNPGADTDITIDLGGHKITRTGTSGNGSAFDVKSGDVTIKNGTIDCTQDDADIVKYGVYAITSRSGSKVTLADLDVTVNSQAGACVYPFAGSHVTIESGNYANTTDRSYQYHDGWQGMAVNQANVADKLLTITGGTFSQVDPQLGDDSTTGTDVASADFTGDGYVAILENGKYVVQPGWNVAFDANGGDPTPAAQRVKAGDPAAAPTGVTKANHKLRAWQTNGVDWVFTDVVPTDLTLVAAWTIDSFDVIWMADGSQYASNRVDYGEATPLPATNPTKAGDENALYTFAGWTPEPEGTVTNNATYTAVFKTWTKIAVPTAATNLVYNGQGQTGVAEGDGYTVSGNVATNAGTYAATVALADPENTVWADDDVAPSTNATRTVTFTIAAVYVAQVGTEKFFTIAEAITAAGGLDAVSPEVITLLANADASVTLTAPSQRLRVALENHELKVLPGDPVRYEVMTTADAAVAGVTVYALEQLKADGLMIVRFDYEAAKLAYDMGTAENMLRMYPTNEPIWCTIATATDLAAPLWTTVESSRAWKENLVPLADATDADLEWLENLDTTSSPVRFWRIAVTPFALSPNETIGFKPAKPSGE